MARKKSTAPAPAVADESGASVLAASSSAVAEESVTEGATTEGTQATTASSTPAPAGGVLRVSSIPKRFCRAGRVFFREPVDIPRSELTDAEYEALVNESMLNVELSDGDVK